MATTIRFGKYHGLGNDFLVVDLRAVAPEIAAAVQEPAAARALCDRRFGVGGDGVLAVLPPTTLGADARMRVLNADGSEAEMCGNGLRCVVKFLHDRDPALRRAELRVQTGAGILRCTITTSGRSAGTIADELVETVTVDMGRPRLTRGEIPMTGPADERCIEQPFEVAGDVADARRTITAVSMGNPHVIQFVDSAADARRLAETLGPAIEHHAWFPRRTNVEYAHVRSPRELDLVVWERGCGITLACGTGACATVAAACLTGRATAGDEVTVHLLGGDLAITVAPDWSTVFMRGPAVHVFDAELDVDALVAAARPG